MGPAVQNFIAKPTFKLRKWFWMNGISIMIGSLWLCSLKAYGGVKSTFRKKNWEVCTCSFLQATLYLQKAFLYITYVAVRKTLWCPGIEAGMCDPSGFLWTRNAILSHLGYWDSFALLQGIEESEAVAKVVEKIQPNTPSLQLPVWNVGSWYDTLWKVAPMHTF